MNGFCLKIFACSALMASFSCGNAFASEPENDENEFLWNQIHTPVNEPASSSRKSYQRSVLRDGENDGFDSDVDMPVANNPKKIKRSLLSELEEERGSTDSLDVVEEDEIVKIVVKQTFANLSEVEGAFLGIKEILAAVVKGQLADRLRFDSRNQLCFPNHHPGGESLQMTQTDVCNRLSKIIPTVSQAYGRARYNIPTYEAIAFLNVEGQLGVQSPQGFGYSNLEMTAYKNMLVAYKILVDDFFLNASNHHESGRLGVFHHHIAQTHVSFRNQIQSLQEAVLCMERIHNDVTCLWPNNATPDLDLLQNLWGQMSPMFLEKIKTSVHLIRRNFVAYQYSCGLGKKNMLHNILRLAEEMTILSPNDQFSCQMSSPDDLEDFLEALMANGDASYKLDTLNNQNALINQINIFLQEKYPNVQPSLPRLSRADPAGLKDHLVQLLYEIYSPIRHLKSLEEYPEAFAILERGRYTTYLLGFLDSNKENPLATRSYEHCYASCLALKQELIEFKKVWMPE
jgi:hypothetical protein